MWLEREETGSDGRTMDELRKYILNQEHNREQTLGISLLLTSSAVRSIVRECTSHTAWDTHCCLYPPRQTNTNKNNNNKLKPVKHYRPPKQSTLVQKRCGWVVVGRGGGEELVLSCLSAICTMLCIHVAMSPCLPHQQNISYRVWVCV